jgi:hypothetical protein
MVIGIYLEIVQEGLFFIKRALDLGLGVLYLSSRRLISPLNNINSILFSPVCLTGGI